MASKWQWQMAHHARIAELSRRNGFRHLDLRESFVACSLKDGSAIVRDDMHPSALGHRCAGKAIAPRERGPALSNHRDAERYQRQR